MGPNENAVAAARGREATKKSSGNPLRDLISGDIVQNKFREILGDEGPAFLANMLQSVERNKALATADPRSILTGAMIAASLKLSLDPNLGQSALVPYADKGVQIAQFQIMTKGYVQLAQRTAQYRGMNVTEVYDDEIQGEDILSGEVKIVPIDGGWRSKAKGGSTEAEKHVAGYAAYFELLNGFRKVEYWTIAEIDAHGKKFSKSYNFSGGPWNAHRPAMRAKTVLKALITRWGPMTTNMAQAARLDGGKGTEMNLTTVDSDDASFFVQDDTRGAAVTEAPMPPLANPEPQPAPEQKAPEPATEEKAALAAGVPADPKVDAPPEAGNQKGLGIF